MGALPGLAALLGCALILGIEPPEHRDGAGAACATRDDCPANTPCASWACLDGRCGDTLEPDGTPVLVGSVTGDCKKNVCKGGEPAVVPDDADVPPQNDACVKKTCSSGEVSKSPAPDGTPCGSMGSLTCKEGECQGCKNNPSACPKPGPCEIIECPTNTCVKTIEVGKVLSDAEPDDCVLEACDENGNAAVVGDMTETPTQTGDDCSIEKCAADGSIAHEAANEGVTCAPAATECFDDSACEAGACAKRPKLAGSYVGDDGAPGNCQGLICDGKGAAVVGAYDADVGPDGDMTDCVTPACSAGSMSSQNVVNGSMCSAMSGVKCCTGVCCPTEHTCAETGECCPEAQRCPNGTCCPGSKVCNLFNLCT